MKKIAALDIIDNIGMGDRVVGTANTSIDYLSAYADNSDIANLGTIKEADLEAVMACEPDIIFIGGRLAASYDALKKTYEGKTALAGMACKEHRCIQKWTYSLLRKSSCMVHSRGWYYSP